jgi:hypothetical protein
MTGYKLLLATTLLSTPPTSCSESVTWQADLAAELRFVAVQWEILDPRDTKFALSDPDTFHAELANLQSWNQKLLRAPWLGELSRFPDMQTVSETILANRVFHGEVSDRMDLNRLQREELRNVLYETDELHEVWEALRDALCEHYGVTYRRQALQRLRELLGDDAFYRGQMPPGMPTWRFTRI